MIFCICLKGDKPNLAERMKRSLGREVRRVEIDPMRPFGENLDLLLRKTCSNDLLDALAGEGPAGFYAIECGRASGTACVVYAPSMRPREALRALGAPEDVCASCPERLKDMRELNVPVRVFSSRSDPAAAGEFEEAKAEFRDFAELRSLDGGDDLAVFAETAAAYENLFGISPGD